MLAITYIKLFSNVLIALIGAGMTMRITYTIMKMVSAGEGWRTIMKVVGKKLIVVALAACIRGFVEIIRIYYG